MLNDIFHQGKIAILDRANVDTDQIIPKQFLTSVSRDGFDKSLFYDWRYLHDGETDPQFELNQTKYRGASVLITGENFGCGSSREHAPWALHQYGFRVIIAPSFADIFYTNCINNSMCLICLPAETIARIKAVVNEDSEPTAIQVDLQSQQLWLANVGCVSFDIPQLVKKRLLAGLDFIGVAEAQIASISAYEKRIENNC